MASCGLTGESPLKPEDLAAPGQPASLSISPPGDLAGQAPRQCRDQIREVERALTETLEASFRDSRVWSASSDEEVASVVLAGLGRYLDREDLVEEVLGGLRASRPVGAEVITELASVLPRNAQPVSDPFIYRSIWTVTSRNVDTTVATVVFAGYEVNDRADKTPIIIGRGFSVRLSPGGKNSFSIQATIDGTVWLADGCSTVVDGQFRPTDHLPDRAIDALRKEFSDTSPADPLAALVRATKAGELDPMTDSDEHRCLANSTPNGTRMTRDRDSSGSPAGPE